MCWTVNASLINRAPSAEQTTKFQHFKSLVQAFFLVLQNSLINISAYLRTYTPIMTYLWYWPITSGNWYICLTLLIIHFWSHTVLTSCDISLFYLSLASGYMIRRAQAASKAACRWSFTHYDYWTWGSEVNVERLGTSSQQIKSGTPAAVLRVLSSILRPIILKQATFTEGGGQGAAPLQQLSKVFLTGAVYWVWHCTQGWLQEHRDNEFKLNRSHSYSSNMSHKVNLVVEVLHLLSNKCQIKSFAAGLWPQDGFFVSVYSLLKKLFYILWNFDYLTLLCLIFKSKLWQ